MTRRRGCVRCVDVRVADDVVICANSRRKSVCGFVGMSYLRIMEILREKGPGWRVVPRGEYKRVFEVVNEARV